MEGNGYSCQPKSGKGATKSISRLCLLMCGAIVLSSICCKLFSEMLNPMRHQILDLAEIGLSIRTRRISKIFEEIASVINCEWTELPNSRNELEALL